MKALLKNFVKSLLEKLNITSKEDFIKFCFQFIKFGVVGISNTILSLVVYYTLCYFGVNYLIAYTISFIISVLNAFYWNNKYVFKKTGEGILKPLIKTYIAYGGSFLLSLLLMYIMVDIFYISDKIAPILILVVTIPINFVVNKFWSFK